MAKWVSQAKTSSVSNSARGRVRYLCNQGLYAEVERIVRRYFQTNPHGEDVTLEVLVTLGRDRLVALGGGEKHLDRTKQDVGRLVAMVLVDIFGAARILTFRDDNEHDVSTRLAARADAPWISRYTPHRLLRQSDQTPCRIVLDTNVVRDIVQGIAPTGKQSDLLDLGALGRLKSDHPVSIADPAWAELTAALARGAIPFDLWAARIALLDRVLDPDLPLLPGGRELAALAGLEPSPAFDAAEAVSYAKAAWRYLAQAKSLGDLQRPYDFHGHTGRLFRMGPLPLDKPAQLVDERGAGWAQLMARILEAFQGGSSPQPGTLSKQPSIDELVPIIKAVLLRTMPAEKAERLSLLVHVLARYALRATDPETPYLGKTNDAIDFDILYAVVLPAVICTSDQAMLNLARRSGSVDGNLVKSPVELVAWLATGADARAA